LFNADNPIRLIKTKNGKITTILCDENTSIKLYREYHMGAKAKWKIEKILSRCCCGAGTGQASFYRWIEIRLW